MDTPIALFFYKRPDAVKQVFERIRRARPKKLFLIADGPKDQSELEKCQKTREVVENIDWDCLVKKNYSEKNLQCGIRVTSGINWVFEQVDRAIILEDDCVPDETFFPFCEELLERYKNTEKIMQISGSNFQRLNPEYKCDNSYYFSRFPTIWGWATWKRAWGFYDISMMQWATINRKKFLNEVFTDPIWADFLKHAYDLVYSTKRADFWDDQWCFAVFLREGVSIVPQTNLVTNIGQRMDNTHSFPNEGGGDLFDIPLQKMAFPLIHPTDIKTSKNADDHYLNLVKKASSVSEPLSKKWLAKIRNLFNPHSYK